MCTETEKLCGWETEREGGGWGGEEERRERRRCEAHSERKWNYSHKRYLVKGLRNGSVGEE